MLRRYLKKYGPIRLTVFITALSILTSVLITILVNYLFSNEFVGFTGLLIAIFVPALLAPTFSSIQLSLLSQLVQAEEKLHKLAITDDLTQVYNRRYFIELAKETLAQAKQQGGKFSILILDMDNFKYINDTYGHGAGDQMLRFFSESCRAVLPDTASLARYGGDEFVLLLRDADHLEANQYANTLRIMLANLRLPLGEDHISLEASFGSATYTPHIVDLDTLLAQADQAMYIEKRRKGALTSG